jgi:hypothetical protein
VSSEPIRILPRRSSRLTLNASRPSVSAQAVVGSRHCLIGPVRRRWSSTSASSLERSASEKYRQLSLFLLQFSCSRRMSFLLLFFVTPPLLQKSIHFGTFFFRYVSSISTLENRAIHLTLCATKIKFSFGRCKLDLM